MNSSKHLWLYLGIFFALMSSITAIVVWRFVPDHFEWFEKLFPILVAACLGAGIGARTSSLSVEPSETTRAEFNERSLQQSRFQQNLLKAPIVWVGAFTIVVFTAIYYLT